MLTQLSLAFVLLGLGSAEAQTGWTLSWSDEFNGTALDTTKWKYDLGGNGWGNQELENYTNRADNVYLEGGKLVIKAIKESYQGSQYTSGRILTQGKFAQTYGRIEARIKIPFGQGIWPAFWMLGSNITTAGWPGCGEIDIMENVGREPNIVHGTIHGPGYSGGNGIGAAYSLPAGQRFADDFHVYAIEWEPDVIRWYVDDQLYKTVLRADIPAGTNWVFDHEFFVLLNLAVGGGWPGYPDTTTQFPQQLTVDYVRVYRRAQAAVPVVSAGGVTNSASYQAGFAPGSWMTIWGTNLANTSRGWTADDIVNGALPTQLDGVSVTVNGKPAYISFVGASQLNVQAPDVGEGPVMVAVVNNGQRSELFAAQAQAYSPALFLWQNHYAAATDPDFNRMGKPGLYPGTTFTPAQPGWTVVFWGTGFGPTNPPVPAGQLVPLDPLARLPSAPVVTIGGVQATYLPDSAVMTPTNAAVYQLAVIVPNLPDGDYPVTVDIAGHRTPDNAWLTIAH